MNLRELWARRGLKLGSSTETSGLRGRSGESLDGIRRLERQRSGLLALLGEGRGLVAVVTVVRGG